jgi:hypothetical protein
MRSFVQAPSEALPLLPSRGQGSLIWTTTSETYNSGEANQDVSNYVSTVLNSLDHQVLAPARAYGGAGG